MESKYKALGASEICDILEKMAENGESLMIFCHRNPDGDTVGSAFALKQICTAMNIKAKCACVDEGAPYLHAFYRDQDTIAYTKGEENGYDVLCTVDVASPKQMGALCELCDKICFMIDHHKAGEAFADFYTDPVASACGELIYEIYSIAKKRGAVKTDPRIAESIYAAISSDTGSFKYSNTTSKTHRIAAELVDEISTPRRGGTDCAEIARILHDSHTVRELTAQKLAIENMRIICGGRLAYVVFTADMMTENGLTDDDIGGIVDLPRSVEGVSVGLTLKQSCTEPQVFRLSSRSNTGINVADICRELGGGGHDKAAGATVEAADPKAAEETVTARFAAAVEAELSASRDI